MSIAGLTTKKMKDGRFLIQIEDAITKEPYAHIKLDKNDLKRTMKLWNRLLEEN